jgi:hypothetical protein
MARKVVKKSPPASPRPSAAQVKRVSDDVLAQLEGSADASAGAPEGVHAALFGGPGAGKLKTLRAIVKAIVPGLLEGATMAADGALSADELLRIVEIVKRTVREVATIRAGATSPVLSRPPGSPPLPPGASPPPAPAA